MVAALAESKAGVSLLLEVTDFFWFANNWSGSNALQYEAVLKVFDGKGKQVLKEPLSAVLRYNNWGGPGSARTEDGRRLASHGARGLAQLLVEQALTRPGVVERLRGK